VEPTGVHRDDTHPLAGDQPIIPRGRSEYKHSCSCAERRCDLPQVGKRAPSAESFTTATREVRLLGRRPPLNGRSSCSRPVDGLQITVIYSGDPAYATSASPALALTVTPADTRTRLTSSANPATAGKAVIFTTRISPLPDGGTVTFISGKTVPAHCRSVPANTKTGLAICRKTYIAAGSHIIHLAYSGDADYRPSTAKPFTEHVASKPSTSPPDGLVKPALGLKIIKQPAVITQHRAPERSRPPPHKPAVHICNSPATAAHQEINRSSSTRTS
jgi:Bacterial Ig-like domain (group 3)